MRLKESEIAGIVHGIEPFIINTSASLRLYGSRLDNDKKGGDIDLMLIVSTEAKEKIKRVKHRILSEIKKNIGDRKIDLLICDTASLDTDPFLSLVFPSSKSLKEWK